MTVIAGFWDGARRRAAIAGDRCDQAGDTKTRAAPKVVQLPGPRPILFGSAGLVLTRRFWHRQAGPTEDESVQEWAWSRQEAFHRWLKDAGHGESAFGAFGCQFQALIVFEGGILELTGEGGVHLVEPAAGLSTLRYHAAGCGQQAALGALYGLVRESLEYHATADLVRTAALAACAHVVGCEGPVDTLELDWGEP